MNGKEEKEKADRQKEKELSADRKKKKDEELDREIEQSFPASDPPSYSQPRNDKEE